MIFELPFDLLVKTRTNPPIPTHPMLYRQLFFLLLYRVINGIAADVAASVRVTAYGRYEVTSW